MSSINSRQSVLAAKRAKLEELRRTRELKEKEKSSRLSLTPTRSSLTPTKNVFSPSASPSPLLMARSIENVDTLVEKLMNASIESSSSTPVSKKQTKDVSIQVEAPEQDPEKDSKKQEKITYNKTIQTLELEISTELDLIEKEKQIRALVTKELTESIREKFQEQERKLHESKVSENSTKPPGSIAEFDEKKMVDFLSHSFKFVNRALDEEYDLLTDYSKAEFKADSSISEPIKNQSSLFIEELCNRSINFLDWSPHYPELIVVAYTSPNKVSTSSHKQQYSYHQKFNAKGLVLIWNLKSPSYPEFILTATTEILSVKFAKHNSFSIFGTGFNGKVMSWDLREVDKTELANPILQSPFSNNNKSLLTHSQPIYALTQIHSDANTIQKQDEITNNGLLITASTDGLICSWSPYLLAQPNSTPIQLKPPNEILSRYDELAPTQLITLSNDVGGFIVGCEDGHIYRVNRFDTPLIKVGIDSNNIWEGHSNGVITSLSPLINSNDNLYGDIFISSGLDWSIKLWKLNLANTVAQNRLTTPPVSSGNDSLNDSFMGLNSIDYQKPLLTILRSNVIMDLNWRPNYKSQFVAVGFEGILEFWDLSKDQLNPVYEIPCQQFNPPTYEAVISEKKSLNKVAFNSTGDQIATGGLNGVLYIFKLDLEEESLKENNLEKFYSLIH